MRKSKQEHAFVARRAFRSADGVVRRSDLVEAFEMSTSKATQVLALELEVSAATLVRDGYLVRRRVGAAAPKHATMKDLMEKLDAGQSDFCHTGLRPDELPVNTWQWCENTPFDEIALDLVIEACVKKIAVLIRYVGMRRGEKGTWRRIAPVSLDRMGDQWRVTAQDLEKAGAPLRTFVMARIIEARHDTNPLPKSLQRAHPNDSTQRVPIGFNLGLSEVQRQVLGREMKIKDGHVEIPSRCWHEFLIRFADGERSDDIAWPPLKRIDR